MSDLSICIPTYNRADLLAVSLRSLLEGLREQGLEDRVAVCVSDNASNDHTQQVIAAIGADFPGLRHRRNERNLGFGGNLWSVVRFAQTDYVLLLGDDDEISVEALVEIRAVLDWLKPDLLLLNSAPGHKVARVQSGPPSPRRIADLDLYLTELGAFHATFIGNLVFRRAAFLAVPEGAYIAQSAYPHMVPVLDCLGRGTVFFLPIRLVQPDDSHRGWRQLQPIYTAIDLAQVYARFGVPALPRRISSRLRLALYLARSLPKAWCLVVTGKVKSESANPFCSTRPGNVARIYARLLVPQSWRSGGDAAPRQPGIGA